MEQHHSDSKTCSCEVFDVNYKTTCRATELLQPASWPLPNRQKISTRFLHGIGAGFDTIIAARILPI